MTLCPIALLPLAQSVPSLGCARLKRLLVILFQKLNPSTMPQKHKAAIPNKTLAWLRTGYRIRRLTQASVTRASNR